METIGTTEYILTANGIANTNLRCISKGQDNNFQAYRDFKKCVFQIQKHQNFKFKDELARYVIS